MTRTWDACDVLHGILSNMGKNQKQIPASVPIVHNAFHALAENQDFKPFLSEYLFQKRIGFFFSEKLQTYLENMEMAKLLSCGNPTFETYTIQDKLCASFKQYYEGNFSNDEKEMLMKMAQVFQEKLAEERSVRAA